VDQIIIPFQPFQRKNTDSKVLPNSVFINLLFIYIKSKGIKIFAPNAFGFSYLKLYFWGVIIKILNVIYKMPQKADRKMHFFSPFFALFLLQNHYI
jgi:hypothetical protein